MPTAVIKCTCQNDSQDEEHGKNMRVHNETTKKSGNEPYYRCTVCLKERTKTKL